VVGLFCRNRQVLEVAGSRKPNKIKVQVDWHCPCIVFRERVQRRNGFTELQMGIYGALSSAVTGLRAQSHALENISGNIANSQTTGYKRMETSFMDLIPDAPLKSQVPGAVLAQSRATNNIQGDIQTSANETYIALNTNGFFVVEPKVGQSDGNSVFAGSNYFTRRGDFEIDKACLSMAPATISRACPLIRLPGTSPAPFRK
jgi:flagellar basal body rod protein FlgB